MNDQLSHLEELSATVRDLVAQTLASFGEKPLPRSIRDVFSTIQEMEKRCAEAIASGDGEKFIQATMQLGTHATLLGMAIAGIPGAPSETRSLAEQLSSVGRDLQQQADSSPGLDLSATDGVTEPQINRSASGSAPEVRVRATLAKFESRLGSAAEKFSELERRLLVAQQDAAKLGERIDEEANKAIETYKSALDQTTEKKRQIDDILGHVAGRAIAGDYEKSAADERTDANVMRWASLGCMAIIVLVLGYSVWETSQGDFAWEKSLFRVGVAILLSAPAAYLARESTKHRLQQYQHLQTSLDLKAITPYIASLPQDIQHKIKADMAARVFSNRDYSPMQDTYPINVQELLMKAIDKVPEFQKEPKKE